MMWKALKRISSSNKRGDSFSGKSTLLVSLTGSGWFYSKITEIDRDSRKNAMQRHCDLLNVTKVFNGRVQTWPGVPQKTPLPKVHGEHSLSKWDPGITGYLPEPAVHTRLGGASLDSEWLYDSRTQGRTELGWWVFFVWPAQCFF